MASVYNYENLSSHDLAELFVSGVVAPLGLLAAPIAVLAGGASLVRAIEAGGQDHYKDPVVKQVQTNNLGSFAALSSLKVEIYDGKYHFSPNP